MDASLTLLTLLTLGTGTALKDGASTSIKALLKSGAVWATADVALYTGGTVVSGEEWKFEKAVDAGMGGFFSGAGTLASRSEERRVGKECRSRWSPYH